MNGYIFFYNGKRIELHAASLYEAKVKALDIFKPPKSKAHMVHGTLAEIDGKEVTHVAVD
jgi:hypothetical protein